jgi:chromosomal replication initiation ATPase DnaA
MLVKLFADRQLQPGAEVLTYLVNRCERSFDGIRRLVAAIDHAALATHRGVTVALVKDVIERLAGGSPESG